MEPKFVEVKVGCAACEGKGYRYVQDGPDDCQAEPCQYCTEDIVRAVDGQLEII